MVPAAFCVLALGACEERPTPGELDGGVAVVLRTQAPDPSTTLSGVVITVTGDGIPEPLVFTAGTPDSGTGSTTTTITVPAGPDRTFTVEGYIEDVVTHRASTVASVDTGPLQLSLTLAKLVSEVGVTMIVQDLVVEITDAAGSALEADTLAAGVGSGTYYVSVTPVAGVEGMEAEWGSTEPGVLTVDATTCILADGRCAMGITRQGTGAAGLVVSLRGVSDRIDVTVE